MSIFADGAGRGSFQNGIDRDAVAELRNRIKLLYPQCSEELQDRLVIAEMEREKPKSRAFYRSDAIGHMAGAKKRTKSLMVNHAEKQMQAEGLTKAPDHAQRITVTGDRLRTSFVRISRFTAQISNQIEVCVVRNPYVFTYILDRN